jgi:diacylglycerol kinase family enzyme/membrane-associated phospholipid phosphatase
VARVPSVLVVPRRRSAGAELLRLDGRLFGRVARAHIPWLDRTLPPLSRAASHSILWMAIAASLGTGGGRRGQRAAIRGLGSIAVTSLVVNQAIKRTVRRPRPSLRAVPAARRVPVAPLTTSFPSGHAASAAAFATAVTAELGAASLPLGPLAAAVGLSRVYVGVHYPLDVAVGAGIGAGVARLTQRVWPVLPAPADDMPPSEDLRRVPADPEGRGVTIVVNPSSGAELGDEFVEWLRSRLPQARVVSLGEDGDLERTLREAARECEILGVAGGDGSITLAAGIALEAGRPLLVLPGGTLNHLARDLRIKRADDAIDALLAGEGVGIDVATIDGRLFLNSAGLGAYPGMLAEADRLRARLGRWPGQLAAFAKTLIGAEPIEIRLDGTPRSVWMGFVGNCRHEPAGLAPSWRPRLDDGCLDVRLVVADLPRSRARAVLAALTGRLASSKTYDRSLVGELHVDSEYDRLGLAQDGEHFDGHGSFVVGNLPERLVICARHRPG